MNGQILLGLQHLVIAVVILAKYFLSRRAQ